MEFSWHLKCGGFTCKIWTFILPVIIAIFCQDKDAQKFIYYFLAATQQ